MNERNKNGKMKWIFWDFWKSNRYLHYSMENREKKASTGMKDDLNDDKMDSVPLRPIDKRLFVWSGRYKRIQDVPDRASRAAIAKSHSICRIKTCTYMIVGAVISYLYVIITGKKIRKERLMKNECKVE